MDRWRPDAAIADEVTAARARHDEPQSVAYAFVRQERGFVRRWISLCTWLRQCFTLGKAADMAGRLKCLPCLRVTIALDVGDMPG